MTSLLQQLPEYQQYKEVHTMTTLGCGKDGCLTSIPQNSQEMSSSPISQNNKEPIFSAVLPWLSVKGNFRDQVMLPWLVAQSSVPSITWQRPLGVTVITTQQEIGTENLIGTCHANTGLTKAWIQRKSSKRQSHWTSSAS